MVAKPAPVGRDRPSLTLITGIPASIVFSGTNSGNDERVGVPVDRLSAGWRGEMPFRRRRFRTLSCLALADSFLSAIRAAKSEAELSTLMEAITREMDFRWFALIHHDDLRMLRDDRVDLKDYPAAIADRIIGERYYRRDPVIRGSPFAGGAFLWSDLAGFLQLDRHDRACFAFGIREGLNEGITVPYVRLGECTMCAWVNAPAPARSPVCADPNAQSDGSVRHK